MNWEFVTPTLCNRRKREIRTIPVNTSFFGDTLQSIAERGRALVTRDRRGVAEQRSANLAHLCEDCSPAAAKPREWRSRARFCPAMPS